MALNQLVLNEEGNTSFTKLWGFVAYSVASYKFIMIPDPSADIWWAYLGIVGGSVVASKLISFKYGGTPNAQ